MAVELLHLRGEEIEAAELIAERHAVQLRVAAQEAIRLRRAGFREAPAAIECFVRAPLDLAAYPKVYRKSLRLSLEAWASADLDLQLTTFERYGLERFLDRIYFPILARTMYERGIAPHAAHELAGVLALARPDATLAVVTNRYGRVRGAAILGPPIQDAQRWALIGELPSGSWEEGLVYALEAELALCRRAFMVQLAAAMAARGQRWLSLGRDLPWCERGYGGVLLEKLLLSHSVVVGARDEHHMYRFPELASDALLFLELDRETGAVRPHVHGEPADCLERIAARVRAAGGDGVRRAP